MKQCDDCKNWTPPIYDTANFCPTCGRKIVKKKLSFLEKVQKFYGAGKKNCGGAYQY